MSQEKLDRKQDRCAKTVLLDLFSPRKENHFASHASEVLFKILLVRQSVKNVVKENFKILMVRLPAKNVSKESIKYFLPILFVFRAFLEVSTAEVDQLIVPSVPLTILRQRPDRQLALNVHKEEEHRHQEERAVVTGEWL